MTAYVVTVADRVIYEVIVEADTPVAARDKALDLLTREEQAGIKRERDSVQHEQVEEWDVHEITEVGT